MRSTGKGGPKGKRRGASPKARRSSDGNVDTLVQTAPKVPRRDALLPPRDVTSHRPATTPPKSATPARAATIPPPPRTPHLAPVKARTSRSERALAEARAGDIDDVCAAWAAIVAERMAADEVFAETYERYAKRPGDLRGLFLWDALHAAESHVALVNAVIARHLEGPRADPFAILADLRAEQRTLAVAYAVNAFLAVLNQMSPNKAKWISTDALDPRMAVLALAHQTLEYALESARIEAPMDLTERILEAAQDESVWRGQATSTDKTLAACAAAAAFFRRLDAEELSTLDSVVALYEARGERAGLRGRQAG